MGKCVSLGIDLASSADHVASLAENGKIIWSGHRFRTDPAQLERLWDKIVESVGGDDVAVEVLMEPTRNSWAPVKAWFERKGAKVTMISPEESADLRSYLAKHTKTDKLDSQILAKLPWLHPEGLEAYDGFGPADPLRRAVRRRLRFVDERTAAQNRLDALLELLGGDQWLRALHGDGGGYGVTALKLCIDGLDPRAIKRDGLEALTARIARYSRGQWGAPRAAMLIAAADQSLDLWKDDLDYRELADSIALEAAEVVRLGELIYQLEERIEPLLEAADPTGIFLSAPGLGLVLAAAIRGLLGDPNRFSSLSAVRGYVGFYPITVQSGNGHYQDKLSKSGDGDLRAVLYLAADQARRADPDLARLYYRLVVEEGKHHTAALCTVANKFLTRLIAAARAGEPFQTLHHGEPVTVEEGRQIVKDQYQIPPEVRRKNRKNRRAQTQKGRTGRRNQKSTNAAPTHGPSKDDSTEKPQKAA